MDDSERLADLYLRSLNLGPVVFEPDGNTPPDFTVAGTIGVEVRRLNQNYLPPEGSSKGLEEVSIPLRHTVTKYLASLGASVNGECWYVGLNYKRPLQSWKKLRPAVEIALQGFKTSQNRGDTKLQISENFRIDLMRAGKDHGSFFVFGMSSDYDSGGWVMNEVEKNLRLCIEEKERKIAPYRSRYASWWLVLADHIDYSMDSEDREVFKQEVMPRIPHNFQRVVLIDPRDHRRAFEA